MDSWNNYLATAAAAYGFALSEAQCNQFAHYRDILLDWNSRMNLTAITEPKAIADRHFVDSLLLLKAYEVPQGACLADIGTGAGFPAVPIAILRPDVSITLVDSLQKRTRFLTELCEALDIPATIIHGRAEDLGKSAEHREQYQVVTARAVARLRELSEWCLPFVQPGGAFIALKGGGIEEECDEAKAGIATLGGKLEQITKLMLPDESPRTILQIQKTMPTPPQYPRTAAKMKKKPLQQGR